jgi:hypothetical protein
VGLQCRMRHAPGHAAPSAAHTAPDSWHTYHAPSARATFPPGTSDTTRTGTCHSQHYASASRAVRKRCMPCGAMALACGRYSYVYTYNPAVHETVHIPCLLLFSHRQRPTPSLICPCSPLPPCSPPGLMQAASIDPSASLPRAPQRSAALARLAHRRGGAVPGRCPIFVVETQRLAGVDPNLRGIEIDPAVIPSSMLPQMAPQSEPECEEPPNPAPTATPTAQLSATQRGPVAGASASARAAGTAQVKEDEILVLD